MENQRNKLNPFEKENRPMGVERSVRLHMGGEREREIKI